MCGGLGKPVRRQRGSIRTKKVKCFSQNWIFLDFKKPKKNNVGMFNLLFILTLANIML